MINKAADMENICKYTK